MTVLRTTSPGSVRSTDHVVVSYINCTAAVKAQSDLICTSSDTVDLVIQLPSDQPVLFAPDQNLGRWVQQQSGRELTLWPGRASLQTFSEEAVLALKHEHPTAEVIAHPNTSRTCWTWRISLDPPASS